MDITDYAGDPGQISWPEEYVAELEALSPVEQLRYFYTDPDCMLDWMPGLKTVRVPAAIAVIGSTLPKECDLYVGGTRIPESFVSWDGILVRVYEDVEEIRVLGNIKKIGRYAFEDCPSLKRVFIPASVVEIEEGTFDKFGDLLEIYHEG